MCCAGHKYFATFVCCRAQNCKHNDSSFEFGSKKMFGKCIIWPEWKNGVYCKLCAVFCNTCKQLISWCVWYLGVISPFIVRNSAIYWNVFFRWFILYIFFSWIFWVKMDGCEIRRRSWWHIIGAIWRAYTFCMQGSNSGEWKRKPKAEKRNKNNNKIDTKSKVMQQAFHVHGFSFGDIKAVALQ